MIKVLIADDQELIRESLKIVLGANEDMEVTGIAENGEEVLSQIKKEKPDVILMDIRMPEVNGYEATEAIRQMSATVPIIALTAFAYEEDRQKIMQSGFTDFLTKPISSRILLGKLESLKKI